MAVELLTHESESASQVRRTSQRKLFRFRRNGLRMAVVVERFEPRREHEVDHVLGLRNEYRLDDEQGAFLHERCGSVQRV